jgi:DNA-binding MarR family transcriptional regulator
MDEAEINALIERVREVFFALRGVSDELLNDLQCTAVERSVLHEIGTKGAQTVPAMAEVRRVGRQAMQKAIDRLLDRKWLLLEPNPRHARSPLMALSPAGERLLTEVQARERRLLAGVALPFGEGELRRATHTLETLAKLLATVDVQRARRKTRSGSP